MPVLCAAIRRTLVRLRRCLLIPGLCLCASLANAAAPGLRNIVLVHGAFADGSSWSAVVGQLQRQGYRVAVVQNPLTSLADDVRATERVVARQPGPVLLVGHSWGGVVITQAGNDPRVKGLFYLSALAPDSGESVAGLMQRLQAPMDGMRADAAGLVWLDEAAAYRKVMANDLAPDKAAVLAALQQPITASAFLDQVGHAAWHDKPAWYVQTTNDHALPPPVQARIAEAMGLRPSLLDASHLSLVSRPEAVAALIDAAARTLSP